MKIKRVSVLDVDQAFLKDKNIVEIVDKGEQNKFIMKNS